jgi:DNA repair protein RadC
MYLLTESNGRRKMIANVYTCKLVKEESVSYLPGALGLRADEPPVVAAIAHKLIDDCPQEQFWAFALNTKLKLIGMQMISMGTNYSAIVSPKDVLRFAILANARYLIFVHNHPSGDCMPSKEDIELTDKLVKACEIMDLKALDHVIVGDGYYSFLENSLLKR